MTGPAAPPADIHDALAADLRAVTARFDAALRSELTPVARLCAHIEAYRGKLLRPRIVLLSAQAVEPAADRPARDRLHDDLITAAAMCEMIHVATLVHDDVLDQATTRRGARTVNDLAGNETAVILGDYLIAAAYGLCSSLGRPEWSLRVSKVCQDLCAGELVQLAHRRDMAVDESTYFEVVRRKTGVLMGLAGGLGAALAGGSPEDIQRLSRVGEHIGVAFQIQDDLLDLLGRPGQLGKPVGQDLRAGTLTLPVIHHLAHADATTRDATLTLLARASDSGDASAASSRAPAWHQRLLAALGETDSIAYARAAARRAVDEARQLLAAMRTPADQADERVRRARAALEALAEAAIARSA